MVRQEEGSGSSQLPRQTVSRYFSKNGNFKTERSPYVVNGVPISRSVEGCCIKDPCSCRSDVIFYNGQAYDQKPYIECHLRTRPGDVMYLEGKLIPPFNPGKSISRFGAYRSRGKPPQSQCFNNTKFGRGLHPCCTASKYNDSVPPYHNTHNQAFTREGLPYGETLGFFRFKPTKICDCRPVPVQRLGECCTCEPGEYNPAQYVQDDCPPRPCCC
ncbi:uncharacterized protein LOC101860002 isoform X2 [Aplysia californica]|uniref:Uncharacterized protein LOC101860002 isoform X2 n=1 Tax=Aplysia californica TaxID=6500 RepID=A0ABM0JEU6_APLCA|nr:uncharacterized protein LOC101860002 isoform X2 [Aplysia californica]